MANPPPGAAALVSDQQGPRLRSILALVALVLLLRAPGFIWDVLNIDESDFFLYGQAIVEGGETYVAFVEKKPPLIYWFYAAMIRVGLEDLRLIRVVTAFWVLFGCLVIYRLCLTARLPKNSAFFGALVFGAFSSNISVATDCETLMNLFIVVAAFFCVHATIRDGQQGAVLAFLSGLSAGIACGFKHQALMGLVAVLGFLLQLRRWHEAFSALAGAALVIFGLTGWFWANGRLDEFLEWNVNRNVSYASVSSPWDLERTLVGLGLYGLANGFVFFLLGGLAFLRLRLPVTKADSKNLVLLLGAWLFWSSWPAIAAGGRFYIHYFLQMVPGGALLCASFYEEFQSSWRPLYRRATIAVIALSVAGFGVNTWARGLIKRNFPSQYLTALEIASWVHNNTGPQDRIFVWGYFNPVYYFAKRKPASRFINPSPIIGDFDPLHIPEGFDFTPFVNQKDVSILISDLESQKCGLFVDTGPSGLHGWNRFPISRIYELKKYLDEAYTEQARVSGAIMYRRMSGGP